MDVIEDLNNLYSDLSEAVADAGLKDLGPALGEAESALGDYLENQTLEEKQKRLETADSIFTELMKNEAFKKIAEDKELIQKQSELMNSAMENIGLERQQPEEEVEQQPEEKAEQQPEEEVEQQPEEEAEQQPKKEDAKEEKKAPQQEELVDTEKFFLDTAGKYLIGVQMNAVALVDNGDNAAARQKYNHDLSRLIAMASVRKQWEDLKDLDKDQIENINEEIENRGKLLEESPDFQATVNKMGGMELYKLVAEKDEYGLEKAKSPDHIVKAYREANRKTAAKWIEDFKKAFRDDPEAVMGQEGYPAAHIARIMAARELSNSVHGKASTLNEEMSEQDIQTRAEEIMANGDFKKFADTLAKPENLRQVEAVFTKRFSHGGELDDEFRKYLANRPAGELENNPKLKRWMPTVKQRVEALQKQAAKAMKDPEKEFPYAAAAEIVALRQSAEVKRGGKGLEANIPVIGDRGGKVTSLVDSVKKYTDDEELKAGFTRPDVKKYILAGHGGAMVDSFAKETPEVKKDEPVKQTEAQLN